MVTATVGSAQFSVVRPTANQEAANWKAVNTVALHRNGAFAVGSRRIRSNYHSEVHLSTYKVLFFFFLHNLPHNYANPSDLRPTLPSNR